MKNKELIEYLRKFDPEAELAIIVVDIKKRKKYGVVTSWITDAPVPAVVANLVEERDFDKEELLAAEEEEREVESETE
nr:MAG TPA: hypothetical protein [Bacteriophage sp.]